MKTKTLYLLLFSISLLLFFGCSNPEPLSIEKEDLANQERKLNVQNLQSIKCKPMDLQFTTIDALFGCPTKYFLNINLNNTYTIITSQAQYNALVSYSGSCPINIDFSSYDLVIGKKQLTSGNQYIESDYFNSADCVKRLRFFFHQNQTMNAPNVTYHALIAKLSSSDVLEVQTVVNN